MRQDAAKPPPLVLEDAEINTKTVISRSVLNRLSKLDIGYVHLDEFYLPVKFHDDSIEIELATVPRTSTSRVLDLETCTKTVISRSILYQFSKLVIERVHHDVIYLLVKSHGDSITIDLATTATNSITGVFDLETAKIRTKTAITRSIFNRQSKLDIERVHLDEIYLPVKTHAASLRNQLVTGPKPRFYRFWSRPPLTKSIITREPD